MSDQSRALTEAALLDARIQLELAADEIRQLKERVAELENAIGKAKPLLKAALQQALEINP